MLLPAIVLRRLEFGGGKTSFLAVSHAEVYSTTRLAAIRGQSDRNIRKLRLSIQKKLQKRMYEHLSEKLEKDYSITLREREFVEEYEALLQTMGKDAVIRRENKTKPRKKKAALDDTKDG